MTTKNSLPRRRSLNDRLDAELASAESITIAGIVTENPSPQGGVVPPASIELITPAKPVSTAPDVPSNTPSEIVTKKATTIMPKEVFLALQRYCSETDTPKHRALYLFIIEGLHAKGVISDDELQRYREMASQLTTTYEKK